MSKEDPKIAAQRAADAAIAVYNSGDYDNARLALMVAADLTTPEQVDLKVKLLSLAARTYGLTGTCENGRTTLERARALVDQVGPDAKASFGIVDGIFIRELGDKTAAEAHFAGLAIYCQEHELWAKAVDAIHHAAIVAKPEDQEKWALAGIEAAEKGGDTTKPWLGALWNNLGWTYDELGKAVKALEALQKARDAHYATSKVGQQVAADSFVAHALIQVGRLDEAASIIAMVREATADALKATPDDGHWLERAFYCDWKEAELLEKQGKSTEALPLFKKAYAFFQKENEFGWYDDWLKKIEAGAQAAGGTAIE